MPLLTISAQDAPKPDRVDINKGRQRKAWYSYVPLVFAVFLIIMPQFPYFIMLSSFYFTTTHSPAKFTIHLITTSILILFTLTYLTICATRNPGFVQPPQDRGKVESAAPQTESEQALLHRDTETVKYHSESFSQVEIDRLVIAGKWCKRCAIPRPERAHHCSTCGRCVLKMDHHCPWLGGNCVGFRNYPAFILFISTAMLLSIYMSAVAIGVVVHLVKDPFTADPNTSPLHALFIALTGAVFALSLGSFVVYHFYLITTNQTTFEHISPFHLLRYVPPPKPHIPPPPSSVSSRPNLKIESEFTVPSRSPDSPLSFNETDPIESFNDRDIPSTSDSPELIPHPSLPIPPYKPPEEYELSAAQRRFVLRTHGKMRLYDLGWRKNWIEVFGGGLQGSDQPYDDDSAWGETTKKSGRWWLKLLLAGGRQKGDGWSFEKMANIEPKLQRFAKILREITEQEGR